MKLPTEKTFGGKMTLHTNSLQSREYCETDSTC